MGAWAAGGDLGDQCIGAGRGSGGTGRGRRSAETDSSRGVCEGDQAMTGEEEDPPLLKHWVVVKGDKRGKCYVEGSPPYPHSPLVSHWSTYRRVSRRRCCCIVVLAVVRECCDCYCCCCCCGLCCCCWCGWCGPL